MQRFLNESKAVRINSRTNYMTYYENGTPQAKWKIATARPGKQTPRGIFRVHEKDICPPWNDGNGNSAGPCADNNPLGKKALWFYQGYIYGMHGVDNAHIDSVTTPNPRDRDKSSGCVRNHPSNIEWLFKQAYVGMPVIVGLWNNDPAVTDCSGRGYLCGSNGGSEEDEPNESDLLPKHLPTWCAMNVSPQGRANIRSQSNTSSRIIDSLRRDSKVKVTQKVSGEYIAGSTDWYKVFYTLGGEKNGYIHSSLLDCTR